MFGQYKGVGAVMNVTPELLQAAQRANVAMALRQQSDASSSGGMTSWWGQQSTGAKVGIGFAAVAVVAALGYGVYTVVSDDPAPYKANRRRPRHRRRH